MSFANQILVATETLYTKCSKAKKNFTECVYLFRMAKNGILTLAVDFSSY